MMKHEGCMSDGYQHGSGYCQKQQYRPAYAQAIGASKDSLEVGACDGGLDSHAIIVLVLYGMLIVMVVS